MAGDFVERHNDVIHLNHVHTVWLITAVKKC